MSFDEPTLESVVVVGGQELERVDQVMETVDQIRRETRRVPSAVFLFPDEKYEVDLNKLNLTRDVFSPALVTTTLQSDVSNNNLSWRFEPHDKI